MARSTAVTVILLAWLDSFVDAVNTQLIRHETDRRIRNQDNPCKDCWNGNGDGDCILSGQLGKCTNPGEAFFCQNGNGESGVEFCEAGDKDRHPDNPANADAQARPAPRPRPRPRPPPRPRAQQSAPSTPAPQAQVDKCEGWCKSHTSPWEERCAWDTRACSACAQCMASAYKVHLGSGSGESECASIDKKYAVRCCSDWKKNGWIQTKGCQVWGGSDEGNTWSCQSSKSYQEAEDLCEDQGARLCTSSEIQGKCTVSSGCGFDNKLVWTATQCEASSRPSSQPRPQASPQPRPRAQNAQPQPRPRASPQPRPRSQGNDDVANNEDSDEIEEIEDADEIEEIEDANDSGAIGGVGPPGPPGEQGPAGPPGVLPKGKAEGSSTNLIYGSLAVQAFLFIGLCLYVRNQVAGVDDLKEYCDESAMAVQKQIRQMQDEGGYGNQGMSANAVVISPEANALWRIHKIPEREDTYTIESLLAKGNYLNLQGDASADALPAENEDAGFDFVPPSDVAADAEAR